MINVESIAFKVKDLSVGCQIAADIWRLIESLVDEINSQVSDHYRVRIVHEDGSDFIEVIEVNNE